MIPTALQRNPFPEPTDNSCTSRYKIVETTTEHLQQVAYRLRYQVYCLENAYEDPSEHATGEEKDQYDSHAVHALLLDRSSDLFIGTVRMILPEKPYHATLPMQAICRHPLLFDRKIFTENKPVEISRFCISRKIRKLAASPEQSVRLRAQQAFSEGILAMAHGLVQMSIARNITDWFAIMEPSLLRLLERHGLFFDQLGPAIDYHGMRIPCHTNLERMLLRAKAERFEAWKVLSGREYRV